VRRRTLADIDLQLRRSVLRCLVYLERLDVTSAAIERRVQDRLLDERREVTAVTG